MGNRLGQLLAANVGQAELDLASDHRRPRLDQPGLAQQLEVAGQRGAVHHQPLGQLVRAHGAGPRHRSKDRELGRAQSDRR